MGLFKKKGGPDPESTKKVQALLNSIVGGDSDPDSDGWHIGYGSSIVNIQLYGEDENLGFPETLSIWAFVLLDAPYDDAIYRYLMTDANTDYIRWQVSEREGADGKVSVICGTSMLMSTVTDENLDFLLGQVAGCADLWDDKLKERFGGYRFEDMEQENLS